MYYEHINEENPETNTNSNAFYVFGGLTFISGVWSLIGNYFDPEFTSLGVWILDSAIALVGLLFIIFQYRLNNPITCSKSYSILMDKEKIKISSAKKSEEMPYKDISLIDFQSNRICIYSHSRSQMLIDLALVNPVGKQEKLKRSLKDVVERFRK